jgi:hypothetical protein
MNSIMRENGGTDIMVPSKRCLFFIVDLRLLMDMARLPRGVIRFSQRLSCEALSGLVWRSA